MLQGLIIQLNYQLPSIHYRRGKTGGWPEAAQQAKLTCDLWLVCATFDPNFTKHSKPICTWQKYHMSDSGISPGACGRRPIPSTPSMVGLIPKSFKLYFSSLLIECDYKWLLDRLWAVAIESDQGNQKALELYQVFSMGPWPTKRGCGLPHITSDGFSYLIKRQLWTSLLGWKKRQAHMDPKTVSLLLRQFGQPKGFWAEIFTVDTGFHYAALAGLELTVQTRLVS